MPYQNQQNTVASAAMPSSYVPGSTTPNSTRGWNELHGLKAEQRASDVARLNPVNLTTGIGSAGYSVGPGGAINVASQLDPTNQGSFNQLTQGSMGALTPTSVGSTVTGNEF